MQQGAHEISSLEGAHEDQVKAKRGRWRVLRLPVAEAFTGYLEEIQKGIPDSLLRTSKP